MYLKSHIDLIVYPYHVKDIVMLDAHVKEAWEMSFDEFYFFENLNLEHTQKPSNEVRLKHLSIIQKALTEGKPVPPQVLAEYPELKTLSGFQIEDYFFDFIPQAKAEVYGSETAVKQLIPVVKDWLLHNVKNTSVTNDYTGYDIIINDTAIGKWFSEKVGEIKLKAFTAIQDIIQVAIKTKQEADKHDKPGIVAVHYFSSLVEVEGKVYPFIFLVDETVDKKYIYKTTLIPKEIKPDEISGFKAYNTGFADRKHITANIRKLTGMNTNFDLKRLIRELKSLSFTPIVKEKPTPDIIYNPADYAPADRDHTIAPGDVLIEKGAVGKINANMNAVLLLRKLTNENRNATPEEKRTSAKYTGWGGLASVFKKTVNVYDWQNRTYVERDVENEVDSNTLNSVQRYIDFNKPFDQITQEAYADIPSYQRSEGTTNEVRQALIKAILSEEEYQGALNSTINAHYTSRETITAMWKFLEKIGFKGGAVLESSAGIGHCIGLMPPEIRKRSKVFAVELEKLSGAMLSKLYPQSNIQIENFANAVLPFGQFDLSVGNVPFGAQADTPYDKQFDFLRRFSLHNYFIAKTLLALKPGGIALLISSMSTLDNHASRDFREWAYSEQGGNSDFLGAIRLPSNAFKENAGTEVTTDIILFRKRDAQGKHPKTADFVNVVEIGRAMYMPTARDKEAGILETKEIAIAVNEFYADNPQMMLGEMKLAHQAKTGGLYNPNEQVCEAPEGFDFPKELDTAIGLLAEDLGKIASTLSITNFEAVRKVDYKPYELVVEKGTVYQVIGTGTLKTLTPISELPEIQAKASKKFDNAAMVADYRELKKTMLELIELERNN